MSSSHKLVLGEHQREALETAVRELSSSFIAEARQHGVLVANYYDDQVRLRTNCGATRAGVARLDHDEE